MGTGVGMGRGSSNFSSVRMSTLARAIADGDSLLGESSDWVRQLRLSFGPGVAHFSALTSRARTRARARARARAVG